MKRKFWDENTMTNWMNEGEIKSELHATKHDIKLGEKIYFKKIYLRNYFLNYNI